jgi:hypothetical protein
LTDHDDDGIVVVMEMDEELAAAIARLATKDELAAAIAPLATKTELAAAIAALATRQEMDAAIARAVAPLPTREEMHDAIQSEGVETRRHFDMVAERLQGSITLIAEGHLALDRKVDDLRAELKTDLANLDRRVTRLESRRG